MQPWHPTLGCNIGMLVGTKAPLIPQMAMNLFHLSLQHLELLYKLTVWLAWFNACKHPEKLCENDRYILSV